MNPNTTTSIPMLLRGMPDDAPLTTAALLRSRLYRYVDEYMTETGTAELELTLVAGAAAQPASKKPAATAQTRDGEASLAERAARFEAQAPSFDSALLVLPPALEAQLQRALDAQRLQHRLYEEWGLKRIEPFPRTAFNFHGPPGTGKTLAAHAIASRLGRRILVSSYADVESMYHGEAPKNIEALFLAAGQQQAVLFIDEADSLLSRRFASASQGSEQAANSVRSQLLICLEKFRGTVIFATNLVSSYDPAFETRVEHLHFPAPDRAARRAIWQRHLPPELPLDAGVHFDTLAERSDGMVGREIKRAVIAAASAAVSTGQSAVTMQHFFDAIATQAAAREQIRPPGQPLPSDIGERVRSALKKKEAEEEE